MQSLRLRVKKEMLIVCANDVEGINEDIILHEGEEYDVSFNGPGGGWSIVHVKDEDYDMAIEAEEFWKWWEEAPMSELDFREIFNLDNERMEHIIEDVEKGFYNGYYDIAYDKMLESELDARGIALNEEEMTSESVIEYIMQVRHNNGSRYTLEDWVRDTKENYPECLK